MKTEDDIKHLKIIWAFMLEHGQVTNGKWNYYGGWESSGKSKWDYGHDEGAMQRLRDEVKQFGVDWEETDVPEYRQENEFNCTDSPSVEHECFLGRIVTNSRKSYTVGTIEIEFAAKFAHDVLTFKADKENLVTKWFGS